jgi:hypothetical protein
MFRKTNAKSTFENFHLQNVFFFIFLHFYCLEKQINKNKIDKSICHYLRLVFFVVVCIVRIY